MICEHNEFCSAPLADIEQPPDAAPNTSLVESEGASSTGATASGPESAVTFVGGALGEQTEGKCTASVASSAEPVASSGLLTMETSQKQQLVPSAVTGWTPELATVLFRRLIGVLGDINQIGDPTLHLRVTEYLEKHIIGKLIEVSVLSLSIESTEYECTSTCTGTS